MMKVIGRVSVRAAAPRVIIAAVRGTNLSGAEMSLTADTADRCSLPEKATLAAAQGETARSGRIQFAARQPGCRSTAPQFSPLTLSMLFHEA